jgi:flagellar basal-body rod protein FlgB
MRGLLFDLLSTRQRWLAQREAVLTRNVANADTPSFRPLDLEPESFAKALARQVDPQGAVGLAVTHPDHIASPVPQPGDVKAQPGDSFETAPSGNAVVLDQQLESLAQTQLDYELTTNLYRRQLGLLKTALGVQQG